jgi:hypothetical protein
LLVRIDQGVRLARSFGYASSASLLSGYTIIQSGNWAGWGTHLEGECLIKLANGNWRIYLDNEGNGIYYSDSADNWVTWSAKAPITLAQSADLTILESTTEHTLI